jgi:hypothetical protein
MPPWITPLLAPFASCLAPIIKWLADRNAEKNTPQMVQNKETLDEQKEIDKDRQAVADALKSGNVDTVRERNS